MSMTPLRAIPSLSDNASDIGVATQVLAFPRYAHSSAPPGESVALPSTESATPLIDARNVLLKAGFDPASFREQQIVWGDQDPFQHVNNVRYARFFESARIQWMMSIGKEWGGPAQADKMIRGQGVSLILKTMEIQFRRPVTYPDTLLIGYAPLPPSSEDDTSFQVVASAYSLGTGAFVTHSKETLVWYNYDELRKCSPPKEIADIVASRRLKPAES
ncbi:hypothetical protein D9611_012688 [Ephemerocybe angulata]|uniref:Thioesterase/thiol ester dehydrase-isomerase n=1 Tax=Ephemerocybe angulata TaxID=980116 RepID=A0A8H5B9D5_9AGAR|nr:hypothetical protein D9611_012688 [Tulosesus angulatus]